MSLKRVANLLPRALAPRQPPAARAFSSSVTSYPKTDSSLALEMSTKPMEEHGPDFVKPDPGSRGFTYMTLGTPRFVYASFGRLAVVKFLSSLSVRFCFPRNSDTTKEVTVRPQASADVLALSTVEVDISNMAEGTNSVIKWRGKPVFIKHRTASEIAVQSLLFSFGKKVTHSLTNRLPRLLILPPSATLPRMPAATLSPTTSSF